MRGRRALTAAAVGAVATTGARLALRKRRVVAFPPGPDAITDDIVQAVAAEIRRADPGRSRRPRPVLRPEHGHQRAAVPARSTLLPADARGDRVGDVVRPSAHLRLPDGRHRGDVQGGPRRARVQRRRGPHLGGCGRAARSTSARRRCTPSSPPAGRRSSPTTAWPRIATGRWATGTSTGTWTTSCTSTIARCSSSTVGSPSSAGPASRTTTRTSASTTRWCG